MTIPTKAKAVAGQRYFLLADISGCTGFLNAVEQAHGVDFSSGIPAGYEVVGALLDVVVEGLQPAATGDRTSPAGPTSTVRPRHTPRRQ